MENVNRFLKADRVDRPKRVTLVWRDNLKDGPAPKALQRFDGGILLAALCRIETLADVPLDGLWECLQISSRWSHPPDGLHSAIHDTSIRL